MKTELPQTSGTYWPGLIVALIIAVSLSGIADHDLWTPDEPREAAISLSMSRSGNLIIPELAGQPFVEKPPLFYITASFFLLGLGEIIGNTAALRLVSACFGLGTLLFTFLLGKIYFDRQKAFIAAGILATMIGFVHVTHWLLVDNALMFFITATIWALAKAYPDLPERRNNRLAFLPLAGILAAFAFLAKGLIGPLIIFIAWLGIFIPWVKYGGAGQPCPTEPNGGTGCPALPRLKFPFLKFILYDAGLGYHALALIAFGLISAIWIIAFALKGGPELFREWWWTNHFGRFTGAADHLGHISPWYYYFSVLPVYLLPWIAPFIAAIIIFFKKAFRAETIPVGLLLFVFWTVGTFLLLSLSATKRDIYLSALLPAGALLSVYGLEGRFSTWNNRFYSFWILLQIILLGALTLAPFVHAKFLPVSLRCGWPQTLAFGSLLAGALILLRRNVPFIQRFLVVTLIGYPALLAILLPAVDKIKSYGPAFQAMSETISKNPEAKVAAWNLDETTRAGFYYYGDLVLPPVPDKQALTNILQGRDKRFNAVVRLRKNASPNDLPDKENQVIFETQMGKRRLLQLIAASDHKNRQ